jgi:hypothetical protein
MFAFAWTVSVSLAFFGGARTFQGAVAACCLKEGMSAKEVERMLGFNFAFGNGRNYVINYPKDGLAVCFDNKDGVTGAYFVRVVESSDTIYCEPTWWFLPRRRPFPSLEPHWHLLMRIQRNIVAIHAIP